MILQDITMLCGDTSRARCYLQALTNRNLNPAACIVLPDEGKPRPGQNTKKGTSTSLQASWGNFYPNLSVFSTCHEKNIPVVQAPENDINSDAVVSLLKQHSCSIYIYAGFGGVLLRKQVLRCGKHFLHIHGGWLPDYKGSTTNHYSLLQENFCGASAFFLTEEIDSGDILWRKKFSAPKNLKQIDHGLDPVFRSEVLCDVIQYYATEKKWPNPPCDNIKTLPYFIMHPVLRHILLLKK